MKCYRVVSGLIAGEFGEKMMQQIKELVERHYSVAMLIEEKEVDLGR